ncbi:MAG: BON domain-containing protein [Gemmatimonadota bacterium]|nr:BON domain-containing protein [Gemmatimonadota bacterium]
MQRDFDNTDEIRDLDDQELHRLVRDRLADDSAIDADDLLVEVQDGRVRLSGRVGTDGERRIADHILSDGIGLTEYENEIVVDPIRRAESPEAIDDHIANEEMQEGRLLGDRAPQSSDEAEHLSENLDTELFGTTDVTEATESGAPWTPPTGPTPEGEEGAR